MCRYEAFDVVKHFHEKNKCQAAGIARDVQNNSHGITKEMVQLFIPLCAKCTQNKAVSVSPLPPPSRVIRPPPSKCTSVPARAALASSQKKKPKATENPIVSDGAAADDAADGAAAHDAAAQLLTKLLRVSPLRGERARSPLMRQAIENYPMQTLLCFAEQVR